MSHNCTIRRLAERDSEGLKNVDNAAYILTVSSHTNTICILIVLIIVYYRYKSRIQGRNLLLQSESHRMVRSYMSLSLIKHSKH
jgi:uncharacterized membrane protein